MYESEWSLKSYIIYCTREQSKYYDTAVKHTIYKTKKNNVSKQGANIAFVGAIGCNDYPSYMKLKGTFFRLYLWGIGRDCAAI